jgi:HNH endonuclease
MAFITYENKRNPHVTIHLEGCGQIAKHGGEHKKGQGKYESHATFEDAVTYAKSTELPIIECSFCLSKSPPSIRILPLDRLNEFKDCSSNLDVQEKYFLDQLPNKQNGCFYYRSKGLNADPGSIVLFQCDNQIIASATFLRAERFDSPTAEGYQCGLFFDSNTIRTFEPLTADQISKVWPDFERFDHVRRSLDPANYAAFQKRLLFVRSPNSRFADDQANPNVVEEDDYIPIGGDRWPIVERLIRQRRGQQRFRDDLRERYGDRCMITGCEILAILEAAHINPCRCENDHHPQNGLLLRADVHTLFDLNLLGIEPLSMRIALHPAISREFESICSSTLLFSKEARPSVESLQARYIKFTERTKQPL